MTMTQEHERMLKDIQKVKHRLLYEHNVKTTNADEPLLEEAINISMQGGISGPIVNVNPYDGKMEPLYNLKEGGYVTRHYSTPEEIFIKLKQVKQHNDAFEARQREELERKHANYERFYQDVSHKQFVAQHGGTPLTPELNIRLIPPDELRAAPFKCRYCTYHSADKEMTRKHSIRTHMGC